MLMAQKGRVYLLPNVLGNAGVQKSFTPYQKDVIENLTHFIVENVKPARQLIRLLSKEKNIDECVFYELSVFQNSTDVKNELLNLFENGISVGVISDAGCPAIADPGSVFIKMAHHHHIIIEPLVGPSSILLTLMASGLNGQSFTFHGYLPKEQDLRKKKLLSISADIQKTGASHLFIETPYRNDHLLQDILQIMPPEIYMCLGIDVLSDAEQIITKRISDWKKTVTTLKGKQVLFILGK
jgi:16S rRNA (cytidine1402-2'-O)-methyltransferase